MKGSLDNPPIVIRRSFWRTLGFMAVAGAFVTLAVLLYSKNPVAMSVGIAFFGLGIPLGIVMLFVRVELSPKGIAWFDGWRRRDFLWNDFAEFTVAAIPFGVVGFVLSDTSNKAVPNRRASRAMFGIDGAFPFDLELAPQALLELIAAARARWAAS